MAESAIRGAVGLTAAASAAALIVAFAGALSTGAAALLALAIHGLAAFTSQLLIWRALAWRRDGGDGAQAQPAAGPLSFWSYAVAMLLFAMAAAVAIQNGVTQFLLPREISNFAIAYAALGVTLLVQLAVIVRVMAPFAGGNDAVATTVVSEGRAAVVASVVGLAGLLATQLLGAGRADGVAAIVIGLMLAFVAVVMAVALRRVLSGSGGAGAGTEFAPVATAIAHQAAGSMPHADTDADEVAAEAKARAVSSTGGAPAEQPSAQRAGAGNDAQRRRGNKKKRHRG